MKIPEYLRAGLLTVVLSCALCLGANPPQAGPSPIASSSIRIKCDSVVLAGSEIVMGIVFADTSEPVGGFNLAIEYDRGALVFDSATLGKLTQGEWEYFSSRSGLQNPADSTSSLSFIRMIAIADQQDNANKTPNPRSLVGPGEIVRLHFYVGERKEYNSKETLVRFIWTKCDDNSFSDKTGNHLYVSLNVSDADGKQLPSGADKYSGVKKSCFSSRRNPPEQRFNFTSAKMLISDIPR